MDHLTNLECPNTMLRNHPGFLQFKESSPMLYSNEAFFLPRKNELQPSSSMEGCHSNFILPFSRDPASLLHLSTTINNHATGTAASFAANYSIGPSEKGLLDDNETTLKKRKLDKPKEGRRSNAKQVDNHKGVVHVRARRGQATDSHSLAERVRRQKISEKMRCLQGLVPGCYKEMGIAAMLGEIINYVQSLQNQVEFLSMKLSAASNFHNFNMDMGVQVPPLEPQEGYGCDGQVHRKMRPREECTSFIPSTKHF